MSPAVSEKDDGSLVAEALSGDRTAFGCIVQKYQSLICSMAYSATGNLCRSEDLAQDTFVAAWKQLPQLREPGKLRSWLCGIARHLIAKATRKDGREPSHAAEALDVISSSPATDALPRDRAMTSEEEAILWRAIERIPEIYREPLVLYYREHQSIESVATALELTGDAVKQRLSRGRKLLQEEVLAFVEGALGRTAPGRTFTLAVLAALPACLAPAQAAAGAIGSAGASGSMKAAAGSGMFGAFMAPVLALFGTWVGYRLDLDAANSDLERQFTKKFYRRLAIPMLTLFGGTLALGFISERADSSLSGLIYAAFAALAAGSISYILWLIVWMRRQQRITVAKLLSERRTSSGPAWEYRSRATFLGLPLVHARVGGGLLVQKDPVKAWIAIGDTAVGGLFAFGGLAVAPFSIGGCAIGLVPFGGMAVGVAALGGFALGAWSFGGLAVGWQAFGACALAWNAAAGGVAIAHEFALGQSAHALQANNAVAQSFIRASGFFQIAAHVFRYHLAWINLIWVVPMIGWWRMVRRANQRAAAYTISRK